MKFLVILSATFFLGMNAFAGCPEDLVGTYSANGDTLIISVDATENVTITIDGQPVTARANGKRKDLGDGSSIALSCQGDTLLQKGYDNSDPAILIMSEYSLDAQKNMVSVDPKTPNSALTLIRQK